MKMPSAKKVKRAMAQVTARVNQLEPLWPMLRMALINAEVNFWLLPKATYKGGLPRFCAYNEQGDNIGFKECPDELHGDDIQYWMWGVLCEHPKIHTLVYTCTTKTGCLFVLVMSREQFWRGICPILPFKGRFNLGKWALTESKPTPSNEEEE
jgi:hypothetical protein